MKANQIFESIEQAILKKELKPGDKLPAVRDAAEHWNSNKNTVAAAYRLLQDAGLIVSSGRNGSVVAGSVSLAPLAYPAPKAAESAVSLHDGNPDPAMLPDVDILRSHLVEGSIERRLYGEMPKADALMDWASAAFDADGVVTRRITICSGALDAISLALRTSVKIGDYVGVEDPVYFATLGLVRSLGMRPVGISMDENGMVPESLKQAIAKGCKVVILSSRAQNPTGICTSDARAQQLRKVVASATNTLFIDDDHSSMLQLSSYQNFLSTSAERWLVVRSVSKFLGPDMRVAVCAGDDGTLGRIERAQAYSMGWVSSLLQNLVGTLLHDRQVRAIIKKAGVTYTARYRAMQKELRQLNLISTGSAGLNLWLPCPDEAQVTQYLLGQGWKIRSGADFIVNASPGFRITSASLNDETRSDFMEALGESVRNQDVMTA